MTITLSESWTYDHKIAERYVNQSEEGLIIDQFCYSEQTNKKKAIG